MGVDLIADVMAAAGPAKIMEARARLTGIAGGQRPHDFAAAMQEGRVSGGGHRQNLVTNAAEDGIRKNVMNADLRFTGAETADGSVKMAARERVLKRFESTLLASTFEMIMPESKSSLTGGGTADAVWRGQQAQFMADAVAERSPLNLLNMFRDASLGSPQSAEALNLSEPVGSGPIRSFVYTGYGEGGS